MSKKAKPGLAAFSVLVLLGAPGVYLTSSLTATAAAGPDPAQYDSPLAPYPQLREGFAPEVEALLDLVAKNAPGSHGFSAAVSWSVESSKSLDANRDNFGPLSTGRDVV